MLDNVSARKKLENMEKVRRAEEERREKIKAQRLRGVDTSEGKAKHKYKRLYKILTNKFSP